LKLINDAQQVAEELSQNPSTSLSACPEFIEGTNGASFELIEKIPFIDEALEA